MCAPYLEKFKPTFCRDSWNITVYIWLQLCQILTDFNSFCSAKTGKTYETGRAFTVSYIFSGSDAAKIIDIG